MNETTLKKPDPQFAQDILKQLMTIDRSRNPQELNDAILTLLHLIGRYSNAERVYLFDKLDYDPQNLPAELLSEDTANPEIYSNTLEWCADGIPSKKDALKYVPACYIIDWLDIFHSKRPVLIENLEDVKYTMPVEYKYLKRAHIFAAFIMPIFYHSELHGFIGIDNPHNKLSDLFIQQITFAGTHLSTSRENIRMLSLLEEKQADLQNNLDLLQNERQILMVLCEDSISVFRVNLMNNTARTVKLEHHANVTNSISPAGDRILCYTDELRSYYDHFVLKDSAPNLLEHLTPEALQKELTGKDRISYRYQSLPNSLDQVFFEVRVTKILQTDDNFEVLIAFRHIDDIVKEERQHQRELEQALYETKKKNQILSTISKIYVSIYRINLISDQYDVISDDMFGNTSATHTGSARLMFREICHTTVAPEYLEQSLHFFNLSTLQQRLRYDETTAIEYLAQDGNWHLMRFIVQKRDLSGNVTEVLCVIRIVSEEKRREKYWIVAAEEANKASAAKSDFLSRMSHDIRTPMNVIMGLVNLSRNHLDASFKDGFSITDYEKLKDYLNKIQLSGTHLQQLVNDILDMSRIESGNFELMAQPLKVSDTIRFLEQTIFSSPGTKPLNFLCKKHHILYDTILADSLRLGQIYLNLLSNAVKYTPEGGTVQLEIYEEPATDPDHIRLISIISDTGIGMTEDFMKVMYSDFSRAVDTRVNKVRGSGLGLSIVKRLVDLMDGTIEVKSKPQKGTTFYLTLEFPYIEDDSPEASGGSLIPETEVHPDRPLKLLVAEDNELNYEILEEQLLPYDIHCIRAEDGKQCLHIFQTSEMESTPFDAILMDMQMPVMSGVEATKNIRAFPGTYARNIPIIATTANAYQEDIRECLDAGMNTHLSKPLDIEKLVRMLAEYIKN